MVKTPLYPFLIDAVGQAISARAYSRHISDHLQIVANDPGMPPLSLGIVRLTPPIFRAAAFLQAWSACRYCEIQHINFQSLMLGQIVHFQSAKGSLLRRIIPPNFALLKPRHIATSFSFIPCPPYQSYAACIGRIAEMQGIQLSEGHYSESHIFRHLWVAWRLTKGYDAAQIRIELGHKSKESTLAYLSSFPEEKCV